MKQTEKKEIINFVLASLASDEFKTGTQLMEEYASHAELKEYNRKNLKQVFHRIGLSLAEQGKLVVTRQRGNAPLLFSNAARKLGSVFCWKLHLNKLVSSATCSKKFVLNE